MKNSNIPKKGLIDKSRFKKPTVSNISYVISVRIYKGCYRHIQIDGNATLENLAEAIIDAFGFYFDHMSSFYMNNSSFDSSSEYAVTLYGERFAGERDAADYRLNDFNFKKGQKFLYLFDFGDNWEFKCRILRILHETTDGWKVIKKVGANPEQYYDYDEDW